MTNVDIKAFELEEPPLWTRGRVAMFVLIFLASITLAAIVVVLGLITAPTYR